jgi:hypothetical protein
MHHFIGHENGNPQSFVTLGRGQSGRMEEGEVEGGMILI